MNTVVVSEKPKGRVVSFLPSKELRVVRNKKQKMYATDIFTESILEFNVDSKRFVKHYPYSLIVNGKSSYERGELSMGICKNINLRPVEFYIKPKLRQEIITEPLITVVKLGQSCIDNTNATSFDSLTFEVEDIRPIQSIITGGGNVESMQYTMQQQSFYEIKVKFKDADVVGVDNLPLGMILEKGVVKGCPIYAGTIVSEFLLSNGDTASMTFKVSQLPRTL